MTALEIFFRALAFALPVPVPPNMESVELGLQQVFRFLNDSAAKTHAELELVSHVKTCLTVLDKYYALWMRRPPTTTLRGLRELHRLFVEAVLLTENSTPRLALMMDKKLSPDSILYLIASPRVRLTLDEDEVMEDRCLFKNSIVLALIATVNIMDERKYWEKLKKEMKTEVTVSSKSLRQAILRMKSTLSLGDVKKYLVIDDDEEGEEEASAQEEEERP